MVLKNPDKDIAAYNKAMRAVQKHDFKFQDAPANNPRRIGMYTLEGAIAFWATLAVVSIVAGMFFSLGMSLVS